MRRAQQVIQKVGEIGEEAAICVLIEHDTRGVARLGAFLVEMNSSRVIRQYCCSKRSRNPS